MNPNINITIIKENINKRLYWCKISSNPGITFDDIIKNKDLPWCWQGISENKNINLQWDWKGISHNPNLTFDFVKENLDKPWNWEFLSQMIHFSITGT